jgi:hypothetical protein
MVFGRFCYEVVENGGYFASRNEKMVIENMKLKSFHYLCLLLLKSTINEHE